MVSYADTVGSFWSGPMWEIWVNDMGAEISRERLTKRMETEVSTLSITVTCPVDKHIHYLFISVDCR